MPKILGIDLIEVVNDDNSLAVPLGGIIPVIQWATPSGSVSPDGYILCDGAIIPGGQQVSGTLPDLTTGCFLCGSTVSGNAVGNAGSTVTITANQMPLHSHGGGSSDADASTHTHPFGADNANIAHAHPHGAGTTWQPGNHSHTQYVWADVGGSQSTRADWRNDGWSTRGSANHGLTKQNSNYPHSHPAATSGNITSNGPHSHPASIGNPGSFAPHSHGLSVSSEGAGAALDIKPSYYDVLYVMRVK